jgi:hypothetical protein
MPCAAAELVCQSTSANQIIWSSTLSGVTATGACSPGWAATGGVAPTRLCQLSGSFGSVSGSCFRTRVVVGVVGGGQPPLG